MALGRSLRNIANKLFGKETSANDNRAPNYSFTVSPEELARAKNPPVDNAVVELHHGIAVSDPFRPLEDLDAPETAQWVDKQNQSFADFIKGMEESMQRAETFLTDAFDYDSESLPSRYGKKYFRSFHKSLAAQSVIEVADSANGPWETFIDPNTLSKDGTVALSGWVPSPDGTRVEVKVDYTDIPIELRTGIARDLENNLGRKPTPDEVVERYEEFVLGQ